MIHPLLFTIEVVIPLRKGTILAGYSWDGLGEEPLPGEYVLIESPNGESARAVVLDVDPLYGGPLTNTDHAWRVVTVQFREKPPQILRGASLFGKPSSTDR